MYICNKNVTDLILKYKKRLTLKNFFIFLANCFNVLMITFKKTQTYRRLQEFGVFFTQFKTSILKNDGSFVKS